MHKRPVIAVLVAAGILSVPAAQASEALLKKYNCVACHQVDKKMVGPAYKDVAKKYKGDKAAAAALAKKVKQGSKGVWGAVPMPPNAAASDADIRQMVEHILSL